MIVSLKAVGVKGRRLCCLLMAMRWAERRPHPCFPTAHPAPQGVAQGRPLSPATPPTPLLFQTLALDSQNVPPTRVLLPSWVAMGSQQHRKAGQPPPNTLPLSRPCLTPATAAALRPPHHFTPSPHPWLQLAPLYPRFIPSLSWSLTSPAHRAPTPGPPPPTCYTPGPQRLSSAGKSPQAQEVCCLHQFPASSCI